LDMRVPLYSGRAIRLVARHFSTLITPASLG
jgi:hypothetical protein